MRDLWKEAPKSTRYGILLEDGAGLACPSCGAKLRVLQARYGFVVLGLYLGLFVLGVAAFKEVLEELGIDRSATPFWLFAAMLYGVLEFLRWRYAYRFLTVRILGSGEEVFFPLEERKFSL